MSTGAVMPIAVEPALALAPEADRVPAAQDRLRRLLSPEFLAELRWDEDGKIVRPSPAHSLLGYRACQVRDCDGPAKTASALCRSCTTRWERGGLGVETFLATAQKIAAGSTEPCAVAGCPCDWASCRKRVCERHWAQYERVKASSIEEFLARSDVVPAPHPGWCSVVACHRKRKGRRLFCAGHHWRWDMRHQRGEPADFETFCRTSSSIATGTTVSLRGLPDLVVVQLLYAVQQRLARKVRLGPSDFRQICNDARAQQIRTLDDLVMRPNTKLIGIVRTMNDDVRRGLSTPELEQLKDVWDMEVFGLGKGRRMDFTGLRQEWLRRAAKTWVVEAIPRRYGKNIPNALMSMVTCLSRLSDSLRINRADAGDDPARLGRADILAFLQRLAYLEHTGQISTRLRVTICQWSARFLREIRELGLTRPAQMLAALPDDFAMRKGDIPRAPDDESAGRALPREILAQLCQRLPALETARRAGRLGDPEEGRHVRLAVEILIDTGRRPDEIQKLPWDCLATDDDGKHVLIYQDFKNNRIGCRLPIGDSTAALITEQKGRVRERYPSTPGGELALFPNPNFNPDGTKPYRGMFLQQLHREWLDTMPALLNPDGTEYSKGEITLYAYRHSYAQRHADAGTPVDVLRELMGHRSLNTTQTYFRVTEQRTRTAVDRLVSHQFDRHGDRLWQQAKALLDHEHTRMRVGQVAVPFGVCAEPSNVKAAGHACPFRFRCLGCDHFRTDPSYLPDLRAYLDKLLQDRERVAASSELDDWARAEATPSGQEIDRLRKLIRRVETDLDALTGEEQQQIRDAVAMLRRTRTVNLGIPGIRTAEPDLRLERDA
jgi:integrase